MGLQTVGQTCPHHTGFEKAKILQPSDLGPVILQISDLGPEVRHCHAETK